MTLHQISYGQQKQTKRCFSLQPKKDCRLKQHYSTELPVIGLVITGASLTKNWWNIMNFGTPGRCTSVEKMRKKNNLHNAPGTPNSWRLDMSSSTAISEFHSTFSLSFYSNEVFSSSTKKKTTYLTQALFMCISCTLAINHTNKFVAISSLRDILQQYIKQSTHRHTPTWQSDVASLWLHWHCRQLLIRQRCASCCSGKWLVDWKSGLVVDKGRSLDGGHHRRQDGSSRSGGGGGKKTDAGRRRCTVQRLIQHNGLIREQSLTMPHQTHMHSWSP